ncbi:endonuclease VII domain-containing protein [Streptomyces sp. NPDC088141]|uniref:endonuclease VII domain-containing protein n=1 Tax=unclassified Streptomyces TaxID=2593676 RepID=UPI003433F1C0
MKVAQTKQCTSCLRDLPLENFHRDTRSHGGIRAACAECRVANNRLARYGVTREQFDIMSAQQDGVCAICREPETALANNGASTKELAVDHNHRTGRTRSLLCSRCNQGLGKFRDDAKLLRAAADYLESHITDRSVGEPRF